MKYNILVTSAGVSSAINIMKSLRKQDEVSVFIIAIDVDKYAPGLYLADTHCISPPISDKKKYLSFYI